jgi:hypothetical protein
MMGKFEEDERGEVDLQTYIWVPEPQNSTDRYDIGVADEYDGVRCISYQSRQLPALRCMAKVPSSFTSYFVVRKNAGVVFLSCCPR